MISNRTPLLDTVKSPADLRDFTPEQLKQLADELRSDLIDAVSGVGGHFGASLGVVELSVVLHHVFNTPEDRLIWDVSHQAYPHKILTGRKDRMPTIRTLGGVSAFPSRDESEYDAFGVGHWRIMSRHIFPNVAHLMLIVTVIEFSSLILYEAVLSYVGVGVDPSMNSFGGMINFARNEMSRDPVVWWPFAAAFFFMVTLVLAANLFADGVRDAFDPRARAQRPRLVTAKKPA